ncbi:hypothetical protein KDU71_02545 [Carboxylicivirga sediminis]|uniref:Uncharacterized protein n=1 Tax=Carboxylicivirga sediminis TaxID=2006564 RepID=A0A941F1U6_9BACT|nr:hypothetical protein [Carboxylicivirga sediminis]MBR8534424.1 hypothetical protein [Carboxylicivirga sediminis]
MAENRANNALAVLGKVNNTQFEDVIHTGTPRPVQRGRCYNFTGHGIEEIHIPATNDVVTYATALDINGNIIDDVAALFSVDKYIVTYGKAIFNIKLWTKATPPTNEEIFQFYHNDFSDLFTWLKADEGSGSIAYKAWSGGVNGTIVDAITVPYEQDMNSIHQYQDIFSWHNEVGYSLKKFYDLRAENYYADDAPPVYLHQVSQFALQNGLGVLYTTRIRKRVPSLGAGAEWGVAYIPPVVGDNKAILTPYPEGIYLSNDSYGASGLSIVKGSTDPNFPNARFEFDAEFFGGQMNLVVRNLIDFLKPLNDKVTEIVSTAGLANNYSNTIYNWYTTTATQAEKDALDATIPNDMDGSKVNYERFYDDLVGGHKGNKISNIANEAIKYTHPTPITGKFTLLQGQIHNNNTSHFATLYSGLEFSIASIAMDYNNLGEENNYMLLKDARLFTLEDILIPRAEDIKLPPFKDVTGGLLDYFGKCQNNADCVNSACYTGNNAGFYRLTETNFTNLTNFEFSFWIQPLSADGVELNLTVVAKYKYSSSSSFQVTRTASSGPIGISVTDDTGATHRIDIIPNASIINNIGAVLKGTVKIYGTTLKGYFNDVLTDSTTMSGNMRIWDGPFTIGATNEGAGVLRNIYNFLQFELKELDIAGNQVKTLSFINFDQPIVDPTNHIAFSKTQSNHATLINGSLANYGRQNVFHDLMVNGFSGGKAGQYVFNITNMKEAFDNGLFTVEFGSGSGHAYRFESNGDLIMSATSSGSFIIKFTERMYYLSYTGDMNLTPKVSYVRWLGSQTATDTYPKSGKPTQSDGRPSISNPGTGFGNILFMAFFNNDTEYTMKSVSLKYDGECIPASVDDPTKDATNNVLQVVQDGKSFLDCGTELLAPRTPDFVQSDINDNILFDINGTPFPQSFASIQGVNDNKFFADVNQKPNGIIRNIRFHKAPLSRNQLDTEKRTTNN